MSKAKKSHINLELAELEKLYDKWVEYAKKTDPLSVTITVQEKKFVADLMSKNLPEMLEALNKLRSLDAAAKAAPSARGETSLSLLDREGSI